MASLEEAALARLSPQQRAALETLLSQRRASRRPAEAPEAAPGARIPRRSRAGDPAPLSFAQRRLWFIDQLEPGRPHYNMPVALRTEGPLYGEVLARALGEIVRRHEALRTVFAAPDGAPVQVIQPAAPFALPLVDLAGLPAETREAVALGLAEEEAGRPFDLTRGPLLRGVLLRLAPPGDQMEHVVALTLHHIVSDGWSMGILVREIVALYAAFAEGMPSPLPELPVQYADFAVWQSSWLRGEVLAREIGYWRRRLAGLPPHLPLPTDRPRPAVQSFRGASKRLWLPAALTRQMQDLGWSEGATLFMVLLAGFQALLARWSGQRDLAVGSPVAGRNRTEIEGLIGFFVNTLVHRGDLAGEPSFRELLGRVRETALAAFQHQDVPFEKLVEELAPERSLAHAPLFQVVLALQNAPAGTLAIRDLRLRPFGGGATTAKFDLTFHLTDHAGGIAGVIDYSTDLFDATTIDRLTGHFERLLAGALESPGKRLSELSLLTCAEHNQVVVEWNDTQRDFGEPSCVHRLIAWQVTRIPEAEAVVCEGGSLTFGELGRRAAGLALRLGELGVGPESPVVLFLDRSVEAVVALVGVLAAGGAYVPVDPDYPPDWVAWVLQDSRARVVVTMSSLARRLPAGARTVLLEEVGESAGTFDSAAGPDHPAYMIYTSGSTGRPKGVVVRHGSLMNLTRALHATVYAGEAGPLQVGLNASFSFDGSVKQVVQLAWGHCLHILPQHVRLDPGAVVEAVRRQRLDVLDCTPSQLRLLLQAGLGEGNAAPALVLVGGEAVDADLRDLALSRARTRFWNLYGPTECTVDTVAAPFAAGTPPSRIGPPLPNVQIYVRAGTGDLAPLGVPGELRVGGAGLARGYLGRPDLTAERFTPDPFSGGAGERLYCTGDLVRWLPDGSLDFLGRLDHQVKIRGFRIEPGEIEAVLVSLPGVHDAAVVVREDPGGRRLVAYVVGDVTVEGLRRSLHERLPDYMVPAAFVTLAALPLTPSGKVDRKALPAPEWQGDAESYVAPRTPVEEILAGIWAEVLGRERVGSADHFFDSGGHSLLATRVMSRLRSAFGVELPLRDLFEAPRLADLAARVETARRAGAEPAAHRTPPLLPVPRDRPLPLSFAQQRLWFLHQMDPLSPAYNMQFAFRLNGALAVPALAAILTEVVRRHETLRTTLVLTGDEPVQVIAPPAPHLLSVLDLEALPAAAREALALQLAEEEAARPFDLARPPVVRTLLLRLGDSRHVLLFTIHHVSGDGWSIEVLARELMELYAAAVEGRAARLPALPVQYADFAVWQRGWLQGEVLEAQVEHWRRQLAGAPPVLELPLDRPRPVAQSFRGLRRRVGLPAELSAALASLGRREGATGFMTLLAGFQALLHRYSGQESVVVGTPIANRERAEVEPLIGFFANTLALRARFADDPGFTALLAEVREASLDAYAHQDLPFEKLVDELAPQRDMSHAAIFQTLFVYQNARPPLPRLRDLELLPFDNDQTAARFDLTLICSEAAAGLGVALDYDADLFETATADRLLRLFAHLLAQGVAEPRRPVGELPLLDEAEHRQVVLACNATERARAEDDLCLHGLVARQAARTPEAPAVIEEDGVLRFGELAGWAGRIAERLRDLGVGAEDRVGVCLERSGAALAALLGALGAGAAYVPLDPEWPRERLAAVAADAGLAAILTRSGLTAGAGLAPWEVLVEELREGAPVDLARVRPVSPEAAAYVIYTSGSTGAAKGVVIPHRAAAHFVLSLGATLELGSSDRLLLFAPLSFDASVLQIFPALSRGAAVVVHADPREITGAELPAFCERHGVTVLDLPAALWRQWIEDLAGEGRTLPAGIRTFLTGGESVPAERVRTWAGLTCRPAVFLSSYGPTEATVTATVFLTGSGAAASLPPGKVPIGHPLPNVRAYVLDARMYPVPAGVTGELYLAGDGLARGYLGRPALTAASFLPDAHGGVGGIAGGRLYRTGDLARRLPGGDLEFAGRADLQVKIRGFRLELAEVETVLRRHPDLAECVVTVREDRAGDRRLVAYAVPQPGAAPGVSELRSFVAERLPRFMVPAAFVLLDALPLLASGKVDRTALPAPEGDRPDLGTSYSDPRTPAEETLAAIWAQVLRVDRVGVHDNFFELGGDSILSIQVLARANQKGMRLTPRQIFEHPTIAELAEVAASAPLFTAEQGIVTGAVPLLPIQRWFFAEAFAGAHHFNQAMLFDLAAPLTPSTLERAVAALAAHHDALRMRFPREDGVPRQENAGLEGAVAPLWIDLSALPAAPRDAARVAAQEAIQASFDLERGPLTRLAVFDAGAQGQCLLWAAHHLVVDGVSWRVLLEDLETACRLAAQGRPPVLPAKTTSFRAWAERLVGHARSGGFQGELPYWIGAAAETAARLPVDFPAGWAAHTVESALSVNVTLDPEETRTLLQTVPANYRTQINDALLAALARAFAAWTGAPALVVDLEGHGREPLFDDVDLSRTVGWFTTQFPVRLDLAGTADAGTADVVETLHAVKGRLRRVPGHGIGYGLLVDEGGPEAEPLRTAPPAQVSFNYLGQIGPGEAAETLFRLSGTPAGATRHPRSHRTHLIEVGGVVAGGRLQIGFGYSRSLHRRETIERLAASFQAALRDLIARSRKDREVAPARADFPLLDLDEKSFQRLSSLLPENVEDVYPLSPLQQGMLFHSVLEPGTGVYINQSSSRLRGLDPALFRATWQRVVDRHPILRTAFLWEGIEEPVQAVRQRVRLPWQDEDWRGLSAGDQETRLAELRAAERFRSFDLAQAPLLRFVLVRLADDEHELLWTFHHLLLDGWSTPLLLREVLTIHAALSAGRDPDLPPAPRFRDYIAWLQRQDLTATEAFWRRTLAGFREPTLLGIGRPGAQGGGEPLEELAQVDPQATAALQALAARQHLTLNALVLGSWALLLGRYAGKEDVLFGSVVSGRPIDLPAVESMIGLFINTLPVRVAVPGEKRLLAWLQEVQKGQIELRQHEHGPLVQIQKWSDLPPGSRMFESLFVFENYPTAPQDAADGTVVGFQVVGRQAVESTGYPLTLAAWGGGALGFRLNYDSARCEPAAARRLLGHLGRLLQAIATGEDRPLEDLPLLTVGEERQIAAWNDTRNEWDLEVCLHALIEQRIDLDPATVAVTCEGAALTCRELDERANRLAHRLRALGAGPEQRVALFLERSVELMVALLAVLKSGAAYLPLDPDHPADRIAFQAAHARPAALLTQAHLAGRLPPLEARVLTLSPSGEEVAGESAARPRVRIGPDHPAYVLYTSGSTGRPKGVAVSHRAIVNRLLWMQDAYGLTAADRVLQKTPYSFDVSVWELFWPLMTGARLVVARPGGHRDNAYLAQLIVAQGITVLHFVPSMLQLFLEEPGVAECRTLRDVMCSGEALPADLARRFSARLGHARLHNLYGPTEAAVDVTSWACEPGSTGEDHAGIPIGRPIANTRIHLLDPGLLPVPVGVPGELWIAGVNLARGYIERPDLTAERFLPAPGAGEPGERVYRTGDLARWRSDGAIEFLGRLDHQVKIRGFRIELGEIEAALAAHPRVREAVVVARDGRSPGERRLVAYLVADGAAPPVDELQQALGARLPDYMVPAAFVALEAFPLTPNGKVDRKALPEPGTDRPDLEQPFVAPATPEEIAWAEIWKEVLGVDQIGIHDNFFALGGDSIHILRVLARARERGLTTTLQQIYQRQTIHRLLEGQEAAPVLPAAEIPPFGLLAPGERERLPAGIEDAYPLVLLQTGMLFHSEYSPETAVFHDVFAYHVRWPFDLEALQGAVRELARRHATLRTSFLLTGPGEPLQLVHQEVELPMGVTDLRSLPPAEQRAALQAWIEEERRQGFDWARPPLVRLHVHRRSDDSYQLALSFHHAVLDGWSIASLFSELFQEVNFRLGRGTAPDLALRSTFRDFVALEREALVSPEQRDFWRRDLAGRTATLLPRWPGPAERGNARRRIRRHPVPLSAETSEGLQRLASSLGVPVKSALLAAHLRVLQLLTGQADLITGLVANGRPEEKDGERVLGLFLNTLPFRLELRGGTWRELVRQTFAAERERLPFRRFPLAEIQRMLGGQPLFEVVFNFVSFHVYTSTAGLRELQVLDAEVVEETNFPLGVNFSLDPVSSSLQLGLDWATTELWPEQVEAMAGYYARTLAAMAASPEARYEEAGLLAPAEAQLLIVEANDTQAAGFSGLWAGLCVHRLFEEQAARDPAKTALIFGDQRGDRRLTYGELNDWANRLARRLRDLGVGPETVVGLCAERSFAAIAGLLGVLKAGGAYLPLDPAYPPERLSFLLEDARVPVLLCQERLLGRLPAHGARVVLLDAAPPETTEDTAAAAERAPGNPRGGATPLHPAYVIYTSGSTGLPKGVVALHGGLANFALAMAEQIGLGPSHRFLEFASLSFDASAVQIFPTLVSGAALVLHPDPSGLSSHEILRLCERHEVTVLDLPAALWRQFVEDVSAGGFGSAPLSVFMTGGESVPVARLRKWAGAAPPGALFLSSYGPTEATVTTTLFAVPREQVDGLDGRVIPLGRRLPNVRVHLLDRHLAPVPLAVPGEICIGGAGITRGYLGRPDLTAQAFTPDPFAGEPGARLYRTGDMARCLRDGHHLEFLGRFDHQVKVRGFRVEPGEIEAVLAACPEVAHAAVVIREDTPGDVRLVAYVVPQPEPGFDLRTLRNMLQEKLPPHMVPTAFVVLDALPVTAHGKLDRQALPAPDGAGLDGDRPYRAPRTPVEQRLAQVWSEVLKVERAGLDDSFFDLGGHSLIAVQMIGRLRETFQVDLTLRVLYEAATLAELAETIERILAGGPEAVVAPPEAPPPLTPDRAGRFLPFPLTPVQQAYWIGQSELFELGGAGSNIYTEVEVSGVPRILSRIKAALPRWIERHDCLRTVVLPDGRQRVLERVPRYVPEVVDLRGLDPWEVRDRLEVTRARLRFAQLLAGEWPPFEIVLCKLDGGRLRVCARISALIVDGTSRSVLMQDLYRLVGDLHAPFPSLDVSFRDYALAREALRDIEAGRRSREFWMKRLSDLPPAPDLPRVREGRIPARPRFVIRTLELLDAEAWLRLRSRAARAELTPTGAVLAAFVDVLASFARTPRFTLSLVGTEHFPLHPQIGEVIGNFNTIHLLEVDGWEGPFETRARRLRDRLAVDQEFPFFSGLEALRELNRLHGNRDGATLPVLFNSVLDYNETREERPAGRPASSADSAVDVRTVELNIYAPQILFSPTVLEGEDGELLAKWQAVEDAFPPGLVAEMAESFERRLRDLADREESWLAAPESPPPAETEAAERLAPRDAEEEEVAALWRDLLGTGDFGMRDEFFAAGGDSFGVARLVAGLEERLLAAEPVPRPGFWRRLRNRFARWRAAEPGRDEARGRASARSLLRERLMAAFIQEPTVENLAAFVRRERAARATEAAELAPAALPAGMEISMRRYLLLWFSQFVSGVGTGLGSFALGVWIYRQNASVTQFAMFAFVATCTALLVTPLAGVLADRWDRKLLILLGDCGAAVMTGLMALALYTHQMRLWHVYIVAMVMVGFAALQGPALVAATSTLVPRRQLGRVGGLTQAAGIATGLICPPLSGALVPILGYHGVIAIDISTFLFAFVVLLFIRLPRPTATAESESRESRSMLRDFRFGWDYLRQRPGLLSLLWVFAATNFALSIVRVLLTPLILSFGSATNLGFVSTAMAAGALIGSLALGVWGGPQNRVRGILLFLLLQAPILLLGALQPNVLLIAVASFAFAALSPLVGGLSQAIWQSKVAHDVQGRVFAMRAFIGSSTAPLALLLAGPLADRLFEPLMAPGGALAGTFGQIIGVGKGRGVGLLFMTLGLFIMLVVVLFSLNPRLRKVESELPDAAPDAEDASGPPEQEARLQNA